MKHVLSQHDLNVKPFVEYIKEELEESDRKRNLIRRTTEEMIKPYGQDSETSKRLRKVARAKGLISKQYSVAYPCYRDIHSTNSYVFYDAAQSRVMEVFKPIGKSYWYIRFGDKNADATVSDKEKRTVAGNLKANFTDIFNMWETRALENLRLKNLHVSTKNVHPTILKMLATAISQMREWVDLTELRHTRMKIEDFDGQSRHIGAGYTNVKNDPVEIIRHEKSLGSKGYIEWYQKHIGKLASTSVKAKEKEKKSTAMYGREKIAEIIKGLGLASEKYVAKYDNDELLQLFNAIIQENPYASMDTKKKWREVLKRLYQKYHIIDTKGIDSADQNYYGPELYDENVKKSVNNPEIRLGFRKELLSMIVNFLLKSQGLGTEESKMHKKGKDYDEERLKVLPRTTPPRGGFMETLIIPSFEEFVFESKGRITYIVSFSKMVEEDEIRAIEGIYDIKRLAGANKWEITSDYDYDIEPALHDFAYEKGIHLTMTEKDMTSKDATGDTYKRKYKETLSKNVHGSYSSKRVGALAAKMNKWVADASKVLKNGVYMRSSDGRTYERVIFDASSKLGGYVVISLNRGIGKYIHRIIPSVEHVEAEMPSYVRGKWAIKSDEGYLAYGIDKKTEKQGYYSEPRINARNVQIYDDKETAERAMEKYAKGMVPVEYESEIKNQAKEQYDKTSQLYVSNAERTFFINPEAAAKAKEKGNVKARSIDNMSDQMKESFLEAANIAINVEKAKVSAEKAVEKEKTATVKKRAFNNEYDDIRDKNKELGDEIEKYGTDPETVNNATPDDYLVRAANIINKMDDIGIEDSIIHDFVIKWVEYAQMSLELTGKTLENKKIGTKIEQNQIEQVKNDMIGETSIGDDKVKYMLTMAFLQMLIRELGAVHIEHALTSWKEDDVQEGGDELEKMMNSDYISNIEIQDLWDKYNKILDERSGQEVAKARGKLVDVALDAIEDVEVESDSEDNKERLISDLETADITKPFDFGYDAHKAIIELLSLVTGKGVAARYKTQMRDAMHKLISEEINENKAFLKQETPTMTKLINTAERDGYLTGHESGAGYVLRAAKKVAEEWDELDSDEKNVFRDKFYRKFLRMINKV